MVKRVARRGFGLGSVSGIMIGGAAGYFSPEVGETVANFLHIDLGGDKLKATFLGVVTELLLLPTFGSMLVGRISKSMTALGTIIGAIVRWFTDLRNKNNEAQPQPQ